MPSKVKIRIVEARDLPVMDRNQSIDASTDAFVVVTIGDLESKHTKTVRKSLNPVFNTDFSFEILDDSILQNAPVEFKVIDQDIYTSELIGAVYIDMNPLIMRTAHHGSERDLVISGWFPLFDTVKGIRGSLHIIVALTDFIGNSNQFSEASSGVQFFSGSSLASNCFILQEVLGFVADLVVEDDPESSWQDYFRKNSKSSNDQRLKLLYGLSATVRCEIGKKVIEAGGNAVLGYSQSWDTIEGATGIVARGYGTACRLLKVGHHSTFAADSNVLYSDIDRMVICNFNTSLEDNYVDAMETNVTSFSVDQLKLLKLDAEGAVKATIPLLSFGPMSDKLLNSVGRTNTNAAIEDSNDVQLLTLTEFPKYARVRLGGLVVARSVKFLGKLEATLSDQETREEWWEELRDEVKAHARILCCTHICGYTETFSVFGDVCVLSCMGTAATITNLGRKIVSQALMSPAAQMKIPKPCEYTHVPYSHSRAPFQFMRLVPCLRCRKKWVPEIILATIEPTAALPIKGKGILLEARTCRTRKAAVGEADAVKLSGILPFLEYEVQRQLMLKLKVLGMNAVFGYDSRLQIGSNMVILTATCTACFVGSLPPPPVLQISKTIRDLNLTNDRRLIQLEKDITALCEYNRQVLDAEEDGAVNLLEFDEEKDSVSSSSSSSSSDSDDDDLESPSGSSSSSSSSSDDEGEVTPKSALKEVRFDNPNEDTNPIHATSRSKSKRVIRKFKKILFKDDRPPFILEIDDETDADLSAVTEDWDPPIGIDMVNITYVPGSHLYPEGEGQHLTLVKRSKLPLKQQNSSVSTAIGQMFKDMYLRLCFNSRNSNGSISQILGLHHNISILDDDIVEIILSAILYKTSPLSSRSNLIAFCATGRSRSESRLSVESRSNRGSINSVDEFYISRENSYGGERNSSPVITGAYLENRSMSTSSVDALGHESTEMGTTPQQSLQSQKVSLIGAPIIISPLATIPGYRIVKYLGQVELHFVKDSLAGRGENSMNSFYHTFISEANAIIRAHVEALHGNALVNYRIYPLEAGGRVYRNQAYSMLTLIGDAVELGPPF